MAKIHFIQDYVINENIGILTISAYLKAHGHQTELSFLSGHRAFSHLIDEIKAFDAPLIAFSVMTPQAQLYANVAAVIKKETGKMIIWGGPHPTFMPDLVAVVPSVDIICVGEGEEAVLDLMRCIDAEGDMTTIANCWVRDTGGWIKNPVRPLEENLDKYPFPDRELFYSKCAFVRNLDLKRIMIQRGCPYDCNYCFEHMMKDIYKGRGRLVRTHSVDYAIAECRQILDRYPTKIFHFSDDSLNLNKRWFAEFLVRYQQEIRVPFTCNLAVPLIDEELARRLKAAGCRGVVFGVESANDRIRMEILNKKVTRQQYIKAASCLRATGIKILTNNMVGLPTETLDDAIETVRFNRELKVSSIRICILKAYYGTKLAEYIIKNNLHERQEKYTVMVKDERREYAAKEKLLWLGYYFIKFPFLLRFAKPLLMCPFTKFFKPLIVFTYWGEVSFFRLPWTQAIRLFFSSPLLFIQGLPKGQEYSQDTEASDG